MPEDAPAKQEAATPTVEQTPTPVTNGLAIAAMIVGIVAVTSGWIPFWGILVGAAAVVLGVLGLKKVSGKGLAITGIITGSLAVLTSLAVTVVFVIALGYGFDAAKQSSEQSNRDLEQNQQMLNAKKDFSKGETATFGDLEVKVNTVTAGYVPASSYYQAEDGKEYVVLNVTVKNIGSKSEYVSPYTFALDENGTVVDNSYVSVDPELSASNLKRGDSVTGNVVFEVTKGATNLKLQYETTYYGAPSYESEELVYTLAI